jgi:hypothetical protein
LGTAWPERALEERDGFFCYNLFPVSEADYARLHEMQLAYFEQLRTVVARSGRADRVVVTFSCSRCPMRHDESMYRQRDEYRADIALGRLREGRVAACCRGLRPVLVWDVSRAPARECQSLYRLGQRTLRRRAPVWCQWQGALRRQHSRLRCCLGGDGRTTVASNWLVLTCYQCSAEKAFRFS